jgi:hypothetical protein
MMQTERNGHVLHPLKLTNSVAETKVRAEGPKKETAKASRRK